MGEMRAALRRRLAGTATLVVTVAALTTGTAPDAAAAEGVVLGVDGPNTIANSYLVVFDTVTTSATGVDALTSTLTARHSATVDFTYRHALRGFAGSMSERAARRLAAEPGVAFVQQNSEVSLATTQSPAPSWGLDRVDQRDLPLNSAYTYPNTASNVTAYIIDTGIRTSHNDFGGRAVWGTNTVDGNNTDCNGHGTHVAGTVGGSSYGVAKGVRLVAVKVLNCAGSGTVAGVAAGVDWVTGNHPAGTPAVANMSLGGLGSDPLGESAVRNSIADGIVYAIAAGNSNADACGFTPARVAEAITVNASTTTDARASFSNYGVCTDLFAPGENIVSTSHTSNVATATMSGTSMATPHVAGGAALILGASPGSTPAQVASTLLTNATPGRITSPGGGSPNLLLFVNTGGAPSGPVVNHPGNRTSRVGLADSLQLTATGGSTPYTWSATGLPAGMSINSSTGLITGTPGTAATYTVTVTARDTANRTGSTSFGWAVNPNLDNTWSCSTPPGYTWDQVAYQNNVCGPGWAYYFHLRWPANNAFYACSVPSGFVWDRVINQHNVCSPGNYAYSYWLRTPSDGLYACTVPDGYVYDQVVYPSGICHPTSNAYGYRLRTPGDNFFACTVPSNYTWDRAANQHNVCSPNNYATSFNLRTPVNGLWACHVPPGWNYDAILNQYNVCSPNNYAYTVRLIR